MDHETREILVFGWIDTRHGIVDAPSQKPRKEDYTLCRRRTVARRIDKSSWAQGLDAKVDKQDESLICLGHVEQTLFGVFGANCLCGFGFEQQSLLFVPAPEIHTAFRDDDVVVGNGDFYFALELHAKLGEGKFERALVIHLHAMGTQLPLDVNARADHLVRERLEWMPRALIALLHGGLHSITKALERENHWITKPAKRYESRERRTWFSFAVLRYFAGFAIQTPTPATRSLPPLSSAEDRRLILVGAP